MSFFNKIQDSMMEKGKRDQDNEFVKNMEKMVAKDGFTIADFIEELDLSLNSWKVKITGAVTTNPEIVALKRTRALLDAMGMEMPEGGYVELDRKQKLVVAARSGQTVEEINKLNEQFSRMRVMQAWLRKRHLDGQRLPGTQAEAQQMLQSDIAQGNSRYIDKKWLAEQKKSAGRKMGRR